MDGIVLQIVVTLGVILVSMTLHEAMHAFMGYWLGDNTAKEQGRLTLNPLKHIDPFLTIILPLVLVILGGPIFGGAKPVPFSPHMVRGGEWGAALIAVVGPLTNLLIAFVVFGIGVIGGVLAVGSGGGLMVQDSLLGTIISTTVMVNLGFFVFNMLPIPPLDGSRVLYALAPEFVRRAIEVIEQFGLFIVFALVLFAGSLLGQVMITAIQGILEVFQVLFGV